MNLIQFLQRLKFMIFEENNLKIDWLANLIIQTLFKIKISYPHIVNLSENNVNCHLLIIIYSNFEFILDNGNDSVIFDLNFLRFYLNLSG